MQHDDPGADVIVAACHSQAYDRTQARQIAVLHSSQLNLNRARVRGGPLQDTQQAGVSNLVDLTSPLPYSADIGPASIESTGPAPFQQERVVIVKNPVQASCRTVMPRTVASQLR